MSTGGVVDKLRVIYELDDRNFRNGSERMRRQVNRTNKDILDGANRMGDGTIKAMKGVSGAAIKAASSILSLGVAFATLNRYTNSYVVIENRLRAIGQYSDQAGEKLLGAALRSRTAIEDMSTATMRIQKATEADFETTVRRVETLNKLLAVGGATASERGSVMLQLSQALSSGVLQGDELRSLRENAPVEVLDAIAKAAGATRGELKQLGEDGKLTSDIVVRALDSLKDVADSKIGLAVMTTADAFTNLNSAATVFFGRLDEGLGSQEALVAGLQSMTTWLTDNASAAEDFGRSVAAVFDTVLDYAGDARDALEALGILTEDAFKGDGSADGFLKDLELVLNLIAEVNGAIEGAAAVAREAMLAIGDAVASGLITGINAVGNAVESMVTAVLAGVRAIAGVIDSMTAGAARLNNMIPDRFRPDGLRTEGTNLQGQLDQFTGNIFTEIDPPTPRGAGPEKTFADIYQEGRTKGKDAVLQGARDGAAEISNRYNSNKGRRDIYNNAPLTYGQLPPESAPMSGDGTPPLIPTTPPTGGKGSKKKGGGGKGRKGKELDPFFEASDRDILDLERQIELIGKSTREQAKMRAEWELFDQAKERGIPINDTLRAQIEAQAEEFGRLSEQLERGEIAFKQFEQGVEGIADAMAGALIGGESLREGLANVLQGIASDILKSGIRNALIGQFNFKGGGGLLSGAMNWLAGGGDKLSGALRIAGARAAGGPVKAGQTYLVGEAGRELFRPNVDGEIIPNHQLNGSRTGGAQSLDINVNVYGARGNAEIEEMVNSGVQKGLAGYDSKLPDRVKQVNRNGRKY